MGAAARRRRPVARVPGRPSRRTRWRPHRGRGRVPRRAPGGGGTQRGRTARAARRARLPRGGPGAGVRCGHAPPRDRGRSRSLAPWGFGAALGRCARRTSTQATRNTPGPAGAPHGMGPALGQTSMSDSAVDSPDRRRDQLRCPPRSTSKMVPIASADGPSWLRLAHRRSAGATTWWRRSTFVSRRSRDVEQATLITRYRPGYPAARA